MTEPHAHPEGAPPASAGGDSPNLKPCPFCGSLDLNPRGGVAIEPVVHSSMAVVCRECRAAGPGDKIGRRDKAASNWNRRPSGETEDLTPDQRLNLIHELAGSIGAVARLEWPSKDFGGFSLPAAFELPKGRET